MASSLVREIGDFDKAEAEIERLWTLKTMNAGPVGYFGSLMSGENEILAVGAANVLLDQRAVPQELRDRVVALSGFGSIQLRAFDFFMDEFDYDRARAVLATPLRPTDALIKRQLAATFAVDSAELETIEIERFYRTGEIGPLQAAAEAAEETGGWKRALPFLVDLVLINPQNAAWSVRLGRALVAANRLDLLRKFCDIVDQIEIFPNVSLIFRAAVSLREGDPREGLKLLDRVNPKHTPKDGAITAAGLRAELLEKLDRFEDAYAAYNKQNKLLRDADFNPALFRQRVEAKSAVAFAPAPPDERRDHFLMLGFPRSGTTLLENALGAHPQIETFEEIPSLGSAISYFFKGPRSPSGAPQADFVEKARDRYYKEIDRRKKKPDARAFVDKLPVASAEAKFLKAVFPEKKYLFSIRHPYDVVLSCFKQAFQSNAAMDNFTTFDDACRMYEFTMEQWFNIFSLDSENVRYIRYDRLVEDLRTEIDRALSFLGVAWHDDILRFAERAEQRTVRTPSYAKVRSGLSIGVQSSWRKYHFLFRGKEARRLDRWVALFGYEGLA